MVFVDVSLLVYKYGHVCAITHACLKDHVGGQSSSYILYGLGFLVLLLCVPG